MKQRGWAVLVLAFAVVASGCSGADAPEPGTPSGSASGTAYTLSPACPGPPGQRPTVTADHVNQLLATQLLPGLMAADIGASTALSDGRLLWVFGDTVRDETYAPRLVSNSVAITSASCFSQVVAPTRGAVVPDTATGIAHWPMSVASWSLGDGADRVVMLVGRIKRGSGGLDFTYLGSSAVVFDIEAGGVPQLRGTVTLTADDPDPQQVNWGSAAFDDGTWLYVYGTRLPAGVAFGRELFVARTPLAQPGDRASWRFWDGHQWRPDITTAAPVLGAQGGVSQTLSVSRLAKGEFLAVSKRDGDLGDTIATWTSSTPHGPWVARAAAKAPYEVDGELEYAPLAHPEIPVAEGQLLVSVSRNTTDFTRLLSDPEVGRPRFVEVSLPAPDG